MMSNGITHHYSLLISRKRWVMHNITQFGSYYALKIFFHRPCSRRIEQSRKFCFTGTAAGTSNGHEPTAAYQGSSWGATIHSSISEAKTQVQPHKMLFIAYRYSSFFIITHHYAIVTHHYSSSLIITLIVLLIITHYYTTSDGWKFYCVVWRFHATKLSILCHYAWKLRGGLTPP